MQLVLLIMMEPTEQIFAETATELGPSYLHKSTICWPGWPALFEIIIATSNPLHSGCAWCMVHGSSNSNSNSNSNGWNGVEWSGVEFSGVKLFQIVLASLASKSLIFASKMDITRSAFQRKTI